MLAFAAVHAATPIWVIGVLMFLFSVSIGLQMQTLLVAIQAEAPHRDMGAATGALTLARMVGASLGLAANGGLLTAALTRSQGGLSAQTLAAMDGTMKDMTPNVIATLLPAAAAEVVETFAAAFGTLFYFGAGMLTIGLVCALMMKDVRLGTPERPEPQADTQPAVAEWR